MAMDDVRDRIEKELGSVMGRLRQLGGAVVIEEFPGALGDNSPFSDPTEEVQVQGEREAGPGGEGGEPIAPARLKAMPEVTTCVRCQDKLERLARRLEPAAVLFGEPEEED